MATNASFPVNGFVQGKKQGWQRQVACMGKAIIATAVVNKSWTGVLVALLALAELQTGLTKTKASLRVGLMSVQLLNHPQPHG